MLPSSEWTMPLWPTTTPTGSTPAMRRLRGGGNITPEAAKLFEQALSIEPGNPKALLYGGFAAAARGDVVAARNRWLALKELHPPAQIEQMLDARIAELGPAEAGNSPAGNATVVNAPEGAASDA